MLYLWSKRSIKTIALIWFIILILVGIPYFFDFVIFKNNIYSPVENDAWASFFGSFFGGIFGGLMTLTGVYITIKNSEKERFDEYIPKFDCYEKETDSIFSHELCLGENIHIIDTVNWEKQFNGKIDLYRIQLLDDRYMDILDTKKINYEEFYREFIYIEKLRDLSYLLIKNLGNRIFDFTIEYNNDVYFIGPIPEGEQIYFLYDSKDTNPILNLYGVSNGIKFYLELSHEKNNIVYPYNGEIPQERLFDKRIELNEFILKKALFNKLTNGRR